MHHILFIPVVSLLFSAFIFPVTVADDWELKKDKNGIEVFTRAVEGQVFRETLAKTTFKGTVEEVVQLIFDYSSYVEWSPLCIEARLVNQPSESEIISYSLNNSPWPVTDRDIVIRNLVTKSSDGSVRIKLSAIEGVVPANPKAVRITYFEGHYIIQPKGDQVSVTYQAIFDPAGKIPAWMVNMAVVDTPYDLLYNMKKQLGRL